MIAQFQSKVLLLIVPILLDFFLSGVAAFLDSTSTALLQQRPTKNSLTKLFFHWGVDHADVESFQAMLPHLLGSSSSSFFPGKETALDVGESTSTQLAATAGNSIVSISISKGTCELESEVLLDVSHLFLDFSVFVTENKPILKMAQVIGRILLLAQDYIPDQHVSPEELGIQVIMIALCIGNQSQVGTKSTSGTSNSNTIITTTTTSTLNHPRNATGTEASIEEA